MKTINSSSTPAHEAGVFISHLLREPQGERVLLMLSGGSAIDVLDHIDPEVLTKDITIQMIDERFSDKPEENNFMQIQQTAFYKDARAAGVTFIESIPAADELHIAFAKRLREQLTETLSMGSKPRVIGLFGIGNDGHTASIFPSAKKEFDSTYGTQELYVGVESDNDIPLRTSVTPHFIENFVDEAIMFAKGKQEILLTAFNHDQAHDVPAKLVLDHPNCALFTDAELPVV